jgi:UDP-N-acetylmuramoyl-tripeptide--D-alanyl-D-alanine ligase
MIRLTLDEIAKCTGGAVDPKHAEVVVTAPVSVDSRTVETGGLFAAIPGEHVDGHDFVDDALANGAAAVLSSRAVDAPSVVVEDVTLALGRLAREVLRRLTAQVIAITGSQGKTSVKDLVAHLLAQSGPTVAAVGSFNNELGVPLTVLRADEKTEYLVLEMGARGIGHIARLCEIAPPDIGVVLNVGSAHLGEFGSPEAIAQAKGELVEALPAEKGIAVLNADDPRTAGMAARTDARILTFGEHGTVSLGPVKLDQAGEPTFTLTLGHQTVVAHVPQLGEHHAINAAAAAAVGVAAGLDLGTIAQRLGTAEPQSPMRMARTLRPDGVLIVDDTYNANPESVSAALRAISHLKADGRRVAAVLGEMLELGPSAAERHREIGQLARELGFDLLVAVGPAAAAIAEGADGEAGIEVIKANDTRDASRAISAWLLPGDVVLVKASRGARLERVTAALGA